MNLPLSEFASVVLDGAGAGTAKVGPKAHGVTWRPTVAAVRVTGTGNPTCKLYAGSDTSDGNFIDGTYTGGQNASDAIAGQVIVLGDYVWAVWTGGTAATQATLTVTGTKDVG